MLRDKLNQLDKFDFKKIASTPWVANLTKQFNSYESRVKKLVKELDLKGKEARTVGRDQLVRFTDQLQKTRTQVEKKVTVLINEEGKKINDRVTELFKYLKTMANNVEKPAGKKGSSQKKSSKVKSTAAKKKSSKPKSSSRRVSVASQVDGGHSHTSLPN